MNVPTNSRSMARRLRAPAVLALALLTPMALAQPVAQVPPPAARFAAGTINSIEVADQALAAATAERGRIEAQFAHDERACYPTFFATSCLENARQRRHGALLLVRPIEVEANTFKRRQRVVERDRQLAERRASDASAVLLPANAPAIEAGQSGNLAAEDPRLPAEGAGDRKVRNADTPVGPVRRGAESKVQKAEQVSEAQKRADNVAAYKRKVAASEARRRDIALKKAEKERQSAEKEKAALKP